MEERRIEVSCCRRSRNKYSISKEKWLFENLSRNCQGCVWVFFLQKYLYTLHTRDDHWFENIRPQKCIWQNWVSYQTTKTLYRNIVIHIILKGHHFYGQTDDPKKIYEQPLSIWNCTYMYACFDRVKLL